MSKIKDLKKKDLPPKWRESVRQILKKEGVEVNLQKISYVKTGGNVNPDMKLKILTAIKTVKEEFDEKKKQISSIEESIIAG